MEVPFIHVPFADPDALVGFQARAPAAQMVLSTWEHYAGVGRGRGGGGWAAATFAIMGWWMDGAFTKRSVRFG